ncbi:MAG: hypothetical protein ABSA44_03150 [Bacteroidota bacterium]
MTSINNSGLNHYGGNFNLDLRKYLKTGKNDFEFKIVDYGGCYGLSITLSYYSVELVMLAILIIINSFALLYFILEKAGIRKGAIIILLIGLLVRVFYFAYTGPDTRSHDNSVDGGHFGYIIYIADNLKLPSASEGWIYYQPPLYYLINAPFYKLLKIISINVYYCQRFTQIISILFYLIFLVFGYKIFSEFINLNKKYFYLLFALFVFWPSGIMHSVRIGNDLAFYMFYAIGLYYTIRWWNTEQRKYHILSIIFAILTLFSKANGFILIALIIILTTAKFFMLVRNEKFKIKYILKLPLSNWMFLSILFAGLSLFALFSFNNMSKNHNYEIVGNIQSLTPDLAVGNSIYNFTYLDIQKYLQTPFISAWDDSSGRQFFFNFLLKTSLWGEFTFNKFYHYMIAMLSNILYLIIILVSIMGILITNKEMCIVSLKKNMVLILNFILLFAGLLFLRIKTPFSCSNDFRYILPILISLCPLFFYSLSQLKVRNIYVAEKIGLFAIVIFVLLSFMFFIIPA